MFIVTAKLDKRKVIAGALALVILAGAVVLLLGGGKKDASPTSSLSAVVKTNEQRLAYLRALGWEVEDSPVEEQTITIPRDFSKVYAQYNALQKSQGFDLTKYAGLDATRYTYEVKNHPTAQGRVVADIVVYRGQVIAGDIQSLAADGGGMEGIAFPKEGKT